MTAQRLPKGGHIDRAHPLTFHWDGTPMSGYAGDTLASALMANGEQILGRSFKYHRPRGIMSAGVEESGALVTVGQGAKQDANVRATTQPLYEGLTARGQNAWPSVRLDFGAINSLFGRFFAAGFYYKTFMGLPPFEWGRGTGMWMRYEKIIRKAAGMGTASREPDPDRYEHAHGYCDLLVVGSGPAGRAAAHCAAKAGCDVILVEQDAVMGGDTLSQPDNTSVLHEELSALRACGVRLMTSTTAFGLYDNGVAGLLERVTDHLTDPPSWLPRQRFWTVRARATVIAAGALERHIAFGDNDRPGVMTVNAGRTYLNRFAIQAGEKIVIATNNDSAYTTASDLAGSGASVTMLDSRREIPSSLRSHCETAGIVIKPDAAPMKALGGKAVSGLTTAIRQGNSWRAQGDLDCDLVLVSGGWSPVVNLLSHRGVKPVWHPELACFLAPASEEPILSAGSAAGVWDDAACRASGEKAALEAMELIRNPAYRAAAQTPGDWECPIDPLYEVRPAKQKLKSFVDPQHDVTTDDIRLAHHEGFVSVEHLKRYTTLGMATDQGKMGNIIGIALMADALGKEIPQVGTTTFRPPYTPVSIGALKGRNVGPHFRPLRRTPLHDWNLGAGGTMTMAGLWHRPWFFARSGETISEAYVREAETVRRTVGLCDVTSLGKIAIQGPDATELLNRVYSNPFAKLPIGKTRYGIMLRDDGLVMDDGTTWRLAEDEYFMTTTTAHAAKVMAFLEELLQTRWTDLKVHLTSVSEQWAGVAVAGPLSREVLAACVEQPTRVSDEALPFMGVVETTMRDGIPARIARISFSGERAFEVYVPSDFGPAVMQSLWDVARPMDGCLYGLEALGALRIEKGHVTGAELDGRVTIEDAGLGRMASDKKSYVGSALRKRPEMVKDDRPRLVGIFPKDRREIFNAGSILCAADNIAGYGEGWITAVTHSPALGHWIGLGFIKGGHEAWQSRDIVCADPVRKGNTAVEIVSPHMYDPKGERMYG
ncbi:MAG: sarcosine oxidase subunit alpha family protein [Arenicellales bacterium]